MGEQNPILNNPYEEPAWHYATNLAGELDYEKPVKGRRDFSPELQTIPVRQGAQGDLIGGDDFTKTQHGNHIVNLLRREVGSWREAKYPQTTRITRELLQFWFLNPERDMTLKLFFAQREAIETAIWLNEVAEKSNVGQHILRELEKAQAVSGSAENNLPRTAFKMATGTGKTVVMAALIAYHFFNRAEYRSDPRFADYFLIVAPGVTIRDRLGVLRVDARGGLDAEDYYHVRYLVPHDWRKLMPELNKRLVITNYHAFEPKTLQGNKRSPFDGKIQADGRKQEAVEDHSQVIGRLLSGFRPGSRLLILNDEAHHCYLPKEDKRKAEGEDTDTENERAAVWFNGLTRVVQRFKVRSVYDLSATPYYLTGSGYDPYTLFGWTVTDFGLIEAIESGLVKIPFLPTRDDTQDLDLPVLRDLYTHVREQLPKAGRRKAKAQAKAEGTTLQEEPPQLPDTLKTAFDQFYKHYEDEYKSRKHSAAALGSDQLGLEDAPPVFIVVCNNTSVSKEVYKYLAGYEIPSADESTPPQVVTGVFDLFSNFDPTTRQARSKPPTLLIDSDALENSEQVDDEFKKVFAPEIKKFKEAYARVHGQGAAENLEDAKILREVVNTVGKRGALGGHIRCVVSVSMLTEGWDANTVTHICGIRKFGSQLLCEQVAGRALRRRQASFLHRELERALPAHRPGAHRTLGSGQRRRCGLELRRGLLGVGARLAQADEPLAQRPEHLPWPAGHGQDHLHPEPDHPPAQPRRVLLHPGQRLGDSGVAAVCRLLDRADQQAWQQAQDRRDGGRRGTPAAARPWEPRQGQQPAQHRRRVLGRLPEAARPPDQQRGAASDGSGVASSGPSDWQPRVPPSQAPGGRAHRRGQGL